MNYFHSCYQPSVIMRVACYSDASAKQELLGAFVEMQGKRLIVDVQQRVAVSAAVTVECEDATFLGEVVAVTEMNGRYHVAISVEQVLSHSQSLMALRAQLLGGKMSAARPTQSVGTASDCVNLPADKFARA